MSAEEVDILGSRRAERDDTHERNAHPRRRRDGRAGCGHDAGPGAAGGVRAGARRIFWAIVSHETAGRRFISIKGLDSDCAGRLTVPRPGRDAAVLPGHRRAGGPHARTDRRSARPRAHGDRHVVDCARGDGAGRAAGPGTEHVRQRHDRPHREHRPAGRPAAGDGRPRAHRPRFLKQPAVETRRGIRPSPRPSGSALRTTACMWRSR